MHIFPVEARGTFVTVSTCTGTNAAAYAIEARTGGIVENMEGAAVAHVAHLYGVPVGEVRGISNIVTDRDTGAWRLTNAARAAQEALAAWIDRR
jgi:futalosine hydrolase